ncbi:hypothetical protein STRDD04_00604 [Streptococcus sp. DD04]|nr:hypothetical protein STRDD04_00604 [Streptococcus sp. DD04]
MIATLPILAPLDLTKDLIFVRTTNSGLILVFLLQTVLEHSQVDRLLLFKIC